MGSIGGKRKVPDSNSMESSEKVRGSDNILQDVSNKDGMSQPSAALDNLKKLQDEMLNNCDSKIFNEICNLVKTKFDFPIENLNLKNPEHLKLIEQVYNPQNLQTLMTRSKETPSFDHINAKATPANAETPTLGHEGSPDHRGYGDTMDDAGSHKSNSSKFSFRKNTPMDFARIQTDVSPFPSKGNNFFFASPLTKPEAYKQQPAYPHNEDFLQNENVNEANYPKHEQYADNFFFNSPNPHKRVKQNFFVSPNMMDMESHKGDQKVRDKYVFLQISWSKNI